MAAYNVYTKLSSIIKKTPLELNKRLSTKYDCNIYFKREDLQFTRSFKIRGAINKIISLTDKQKLKGICTASAGNHAQGVAFSAKKFNIKSDIFVPTSTPLQKINKIKEFGSFNLLNENNKDHLQCSIHIEGNSFDECLTKSLEFSKKHDSTFIHPYDDEHVIDGQSTIAYEIDNELENIDSVVCPIGGGGLISGISEYFDTQKISSQITNIFGVEPKTCASMYESLNENERIILNNNDKFVDGASVNQVGKLPFDIMKYNKPLDIFKVDNYKLCHDIIELYQKDGIIVEPAGALSVSALDLIYKKYRKTMKNKNIVCIISGGNNDITRYPEFIEKNLIYQNLLHYYIIEFNQNYGELKRFMFNVLNKGDDIIRFEYMKKTNKDKGNVLIGIQIQNKNNIHKINENLKYNNFNYIKINDNDQLYNYLI
jgi:threonine dehydratase